MHRSCQPNRTRLRARAFSASTARYDRLVKRRFLARVGVPEFWIVDPDTRLVERSWPDGRVDVLDERLDWHPPGATEPFLLELEPFFADALGDEA